MAARFDHAPLFPTKAIPAMEAQTNPTNARAPIPVQVEPILSASFTPKANAGHSSSALFTPSGPVGQSAPASPHMQSGSSGAHAQPGFSVVQPCQMSSSGTHTKNDHVIFQYHPIGFAGNHAQQYHGSVQVHQSSYSGVHASQDHATSQSHQQGHVALHPDQILLLPTHQEQGHTTLQHHPAAFSGAHWQQHRVDVQPQHSSSLGASAPQVSGQYEVTIDGASSSGSVFGQPASHGVHRSDNASILEEHRVKQELVENRPVNFASFPQPLGRQVAEQGSLADLHRPQTTTGSTEYSWMPANPQPSCRQQNPQNQQQQRQQQQMADKQKYKTIQALLKEHRNNLAAIEEVNFLDTAQGLTGVSPSQPPLPPPGSGSVPAAPPERKRVPPSQQISEGGELHAEIAREVSAIAAVEPPRPMPAPSEASAIAPALPPPHVPMQQAHHAHQAQQFQKGDSVMMWSHTQQGWHPGKVLDVATAQHTVPGLIVGSVLVTSEVSMKWIKPEELASALRLQTSHAPQAALDAGLVAPSLLSHSPCGSATSSEPPMAPPSSSSFAPPPPAERRVPTTDPQLDMGALQDVAVDQTGGPPAALNLYSSAVMAVPPTDPKVDSTSLPPTVPMLGMSLPPTDPQLGTDDNMSLPHTTPMLRAQGITLPSTDPQLGTVGNLSLPPTTQMLRAPGMTLPPTDPQLGTVDNMSLPSTTQMLRVDFGNTSTVDSTTLPPTADALRVPPSAQMLSSGDSLHCQVSDASLFGKSQPAVSQHTAVPPRLGSLPPELLHLEDFVGWHGDPQGRPVKVAHEAWALLTPEPRYTGQEYPMRSTWIIRKGTRQAWEQVEDHVDWSVMKDAHSLIRPPADRIIVRFERR